MRLSVLSNHLGPASQFRVIGNPVFLVRIGREDLELFTGPEELMEHAKEVANSLLQVHGNRIHQILLIGSSTKRKKVDDIDVIAVIKDSDDPLSFLSYSMPCLVSLTRSLGILIECYPVRQSDFAADDQSDQFIKNIHQEGIVVWTQGESLETP